jgi:hypothetical protein
MASPHEIVIVESLRTRARAARLTLEGGSLRVREVADATGPDPRAAARVALERLGAPPRTPVAVVTLDVTASCLDLPPTAAALAPERLRELVRWEIEPFVPGSGDLACAWSDRGTTGSGTRRLAFAIRRSALEAWKEALPGRRLVALYPRVVSSLPLVTTTGPFCLVEARDDAIGSVLVRGGAVESVRVRERSAAEELSLAQVLEIAGADAGALVLSGEPAAKLAASLSDADVTTLEPDAAILGAARHALGLPGREWIAAIAAREPDPPLHRRPWARAAASGLALVLVLGLVDATCGRLLRARQDEIGRLVRRTPPVVEAARPATESRASLTADITRLEAEAKTLAHTRARLEGDVLRNDALPLALVDGVARSADEDVTLERLAQGAPGEWRVAGFALSDTAVQRFTITLGQALAGRGLDTALLKVKSERGRLGIQGWTFEVSVARDASHGRRP